MRWITRSHVHLDRVATPWLIARFLDPEAEFEFVDWDTPADGRDGVVWFGMPGVELGVHDTRGTCFRKVLDRYQLDDPALARMERIIASGVADALGTEPPSDQSDEEAGLGVALNELGNGLGIVLDDQRHLDVGFALYEAVYALCRLELLAPEDSSPAPATRPERIQYLRRVLGRAAVENGGNAALTVAGEQQEAT